MTLPAEMRNEVYRYLLEEDEPIRICLSKAGVLARRNEIWASRSKKPTRDRIYDSIKGEWIPAVPIISAIISVSKAVHAEAIHVLYSNNSFAIHRIHDIMKIVPALKKHARLLRHIKINYNGYSKESAKEAFNSLLIAKNLRSFEICHKDICASQRHHLTDKPASDRVHKTAKAFKKLLLTLQLSYERQKLSCSALDVLRIVYNEDEHGDRGWQPECPKCSKLEGERTNEALQAELRSILADFLETKSK